MPAGSEGMPSSGAAGAAGSAGSAAAGVVGSAGWSGDALAPPSPASALAPLLRPAEEMFGDFGHGTRSLYSGPEMPPSLRTRQKWMAMKITMMNGNSNTWRTYQRSNVSLEISTPPSNTKRTC